MLLKDLFERDNVDYPDWLEEDYYLYDEWEDAIHFKSENIDKWELTTPLGLSIISIEEEVCTFTSYDPNNLLLFERVDTPEYKTIS